MIVWNHFFCALLFLGSIGFGSSQRKQGRNIAVGSEGKTPANFDCPEEFGYYPHPSDCTQYYVCVFGGALLESCTGGLMYSHELQTCDWPRNVGCDGLDTVPVSSPGGDVRVSIQPASRAPASEQRVRYTVVPTAQPQPVISSRGQSRQLHATVHERVHERERVHAQDIISNVRKQQQQQQLYADAEDVLPPAEEIENDRQQRVYRGQPSTVGQVQRDRDGLRHTNAIPSSSRAEKIGVISFGTQQQQPVQQYRNDTFYIDNSLTDDLTAKRRRKRQTRRRLPPIDLVATADSSISWTRHVPVPHIIYQPQQQVQQQLQQPLQLQQPKQTYQNLRLNTMELQPPPQLRYKPQPADYSAILSGEQTDFQPFSPNPYKPQQTIHTLKPNPYVLPKVIKPSGLYQYFKQDPRSQFPQEQNENYSYFNLGSATTPSSVSYAPSNQEQVKQVYYQPNQQQVQYQNQFRPIANPPSHVEYVNHHKTVPQKQQYVTRNQEYVVEKPERVPENYENEERRPVPSNHKQEEPVEENENEEQGEQEEEEEEEGQNQEQSPEIKPEFPSPPSFFYKSSNKYENIENPFADPNFDFDKFISRLKDHHEGHQPKQKQIQTDAKIQMITAQNDSKQKLVHSKDEPNVVLGTPVAFSSLPNKKKVNLKLTEDDYYYDDEEEDEKPKKPYIKQEEEEHYEKAKKPHVKQEHETLIKTTSSSTDYPPINNNHSSTEVNVQNNKKTINLSLPVIEEKKPKPSKDKEVIVQQNVKPDDDEYEYYDDYDYDEEQKNEKHEQPQIKKPFPVVSSPKPVNIHPTKLSNSAYNNHKARPINYENVVYQNKSQNHPPQKARPVNYENVVYQNKSQNHPPKGTKYTEKVKENRPSSSVTKYYSPSSPRPTQTTHKITTIKFPKPTTKLLTTTLRPRDQDSTTSTTRKTNTKNSSRLEESSVSTQSHSIGASPSTPSGRTLYNGSQHYDPSQYDPYYTLYEDDVELYRDVDYTPQQQYTSNRAQPQQHVYRGTPAPVSVQSTVQEETVPQRNSAYYSTQAQDVYSAAQDYQEDNYNTQVDDQSNYRQSSRQPIRGDRNELSYFVESTPKSTTTTKRTTTTTTTTTTPRPIPVQKQSVVSSRSPITAANQTRPQSIILTLSATPGQKSPSTESPITTTISSTDTNITITTETTNDTDSSALKPASRFISLSTGFNLRQPDTKKNEQTPVTYKPHLTQTSSTTDSSDVRNRPVPFSLTKLPDAKTKSVVFRLSSRLSALPSNVSEVESQASIKREIISEDRKFSVAHVKSTDSTHIVPTTYSPPKSALASIFPKHSDNESAESVKNTNTADISEEQFVSILPKKKIIVNLGAKSNVESSTGHQRKSVTVENPITDRTRFDNDKPVKTIVRKLPLKVDSTTPTSERTKGERKIISKIHFGVPQTYTIPEKINNLATTPSSFSSTTDFEDYSSVESNENKRPVSAHYITTDLTSTQRPHFRFSNLVTTSERSNSDTSITTEQSLNNEESHSNEESVSNQRSRTRYSFNSRPVVTTERGNSIKYTPNTFDSEYIDSIDASPKPNSRISFNYNLHPTTERGNYVKYTTSTTEKPSTTENTNIEEENLSNERPISRFSFNPTTERKSFIKYGPSTTEKSSTVENINSEEELSSNEKPNSRFSFNSNFKPTTERKNYVKFTPSTTEKSSTAENINSEEELSSNEKPNSRFSFNSNFNPTTERKNYLKNIPSTTEKYSSAESINHEELSSNERPNSKFSFNSNFNPTIERKNYVKNIPSTTEKYSGAENIKNEELSNNERPNSRFSFNTNSNPTTERRNSIKYTTSTTENPSIAEDTNSGEEFSSSERPHSRFAFNSNFNPTTERKNFVKYTPTTTEKSSSVENTNNEDELSSNERPSSRFSFNSNFNPTTERKNYFKYTPSTSEKLNSEFIASAEDFSSSETPHSSTERDNYFKYSSSTTELSSRNEDISQRTYNRFAFNSNSGTSESGNFVRETTSTTEKSDSDNNSTVVVRRKPIFRFIYNPGPTSTTERIENESIENLKPSTTLRNVPSTTAQTSTSRPLYQLSSSTTTTERPTTTTATTTTFRYSTTTTSTTSTTSTTAEPIEKLKNSFISDRATEKYRFVQSSSEISDTDEKVRSQLFVNRNAKPFRATAELPTVSEILATQDEPRKKEVDSPPTYKPKPFSLTDANANRNRTSADASRNVTLPVRLSRVNSAIKSLTAFGGTRRNSQTPKCNENQTTPDTKCNEIQKQRTSTRGRGSAHYTSAGAGDNLTVNVNRGTPATPRSRPTLKPSTSIVSKASEYVDIYRYPAIRPEPIYPQPQVDKTAAKCRKDVCLLPDCSCGGKEIPGDLPVEQVPQIVLLTFDDSVNDLNKGLYSDLFEKGRTNPNGCPIAATFYVSHEWTDYSQVQNLYSDGHELASHTVSHSFGEQFSQKKWNREVSGQREILAAYGGVHLEDVRGMRAPFLSVGGNKMFKMLYDSNFTYDSSLPVYENRPPSWPYTLDYKLFHDCMIPPCPTRSYPGVWEVPMVMWQDLNGGRCSMGDACSNPPDSDGVYKMLMKNFERHYTTNRAPFGLFYHAAWFTQPHHKEGFIKFLDFLVSKDDVYMLTNWQALQWVRDPTPLSRIRNFPGFQCNYPDRPKRCNNPKVCNLWHKSGVRYMKTCQPCPDIYPWTGKTGIRSSRIDNDIED